MKWLTACIFPVILWSRAMYGQDIPAGMNTLKTDREKAEMWLELARKYFLQPRFDSAFYCYTAGLPLAEKTGDQLLTGRFILGKSVVSNMQGRFRESLQFANQLEPFAFSTQEYDLLFGFLMAKANGYNFLQQKDSALFYYHQAEMLNSSRKPKENWRVYLALGHLYSEADNFSEAEKYYQRAYQMTLGTGNADHGYVLLLFINMYTTWGKKEERDRLKEEYDRFRDKQKKANATDHLSGIVANLTEDAGRGKTEPPGKPQAITTLDRILLNSREIEELVNRGQAERALQLARENEYLSRLLDNPSYHYLTTRKTFDILRLLQRNRDAAILADTLFLLRETVLEKQRRDQLYEMETKYNMERKQQEIELLTSRQLLSDREIEVLNTQNALKEKTIALLSADKQLTSLKLVQQLAMQEALHRENRLMDSVVQTEKSYSLAVTREKEKEKALNAALDRENDRNEEELNREKRLRYLLLGGATLLLLAGTSIGFLYHRQRQKSRIIQQQADNLEILMKEIHHRVKNNMQIVSSLLDLQSLSITDEQAAEAVKEGKNRVQSMALIHQNLYSEKNLKGIRAEPYIGQLLQNLCSSYNCNADRIEIRAEIENLNLDIDTMIPLGLILNEILTNSFKYAFRADPKGILEIKLKKDGDTLLLRVKDNGPGFPRGTDFRTSPSFGLKMIRAFAQKLKAGLDIRNENGALVELTIKKFELA